MRIIILVLLTLSLTLTFTSRSYAEVGLELGPYRVVSSELEVVKHSREFFGSVKSRIYVIEHKQSKKERVLSYLDVSGITVGLGMLAPPELLRSYIEGMIVGWGGSLKPNDWEWESHKLLCRETEASFGAKSFCYRGCMRYEIERKALFFAVEWEEAVCSAKDKDSLAAWFLEKLL
ncbi:MAG: hypothetical protein WC966_08505 [Bradymonadales bacterium]|jgi:hypothetical protein